MLKFAIFLLLSCVLWQCAKSDSNPNVRATEQAIDVPVMAFLSMARARHHEANVDEANNDAPGAINALNSITHAPVPHPGTRIPEVDEVLADTFARIAELELARGNMDAAETAIASGLERAKDTTYFRGHLIELSGMALESRANALADAGSIDAAASARKKAIEQLREAIRINQVVIERSTEAGP